ncbi:MAG: hypothetical protein JXR60_00020 [Bacteroidales bacterium]|nr:hypothetical protein [Bacteroidales bacterium]
MDQFWNSSNLFKILIKWKWHIIIITFVGMAIIGGSTYLIKPKYQSQAIVYPVNLGELSDESFSEQMIQILKSRDITDNVMHKFDLPKHYGIDSTYKHFRSTMYYLYSENISISKTEYESVEITALDTDPDTAAYIVESILEFYNEKVREMHRLKLNELIVLNQKHTMVWKTAKDSVENRLKVLNQDQGMLDYTNQVTELTQGIFRSNGNQKLIDKAEKGLDDFKKYGLEYTFLTQKYWRVLDLYFQYKLAIDQQIVEYNKEITYAHIISSPYPSDNKYSPKRIPITLLGGLSVFSLLILVIGFIESRRQNL